MHTLESSDNVAQPTEKPQIRPSQIQAIWQRLRGMRGFLSKGGAAIADQGLFAGTNFLINVLLARLMTPAQYGAFATAYAIFLLLGSFYIAVIIEPMLVYGSGKYHERWTRYLGIMFYGHWWLSLVLSGILLVVAWAFQHTGASALLAEASLGLVIALPLILLQWTLRRAFYVKSQPQHAASGGAVYLGAMLVCTGFVAASGILSAFTALLIMAAASFVTCIWFILLLKPRFLKKDDDLSLTIVLKDHAHYGKWSAPTMLLTWIPSNIYYTVLPIAVGLQASGMLRASMNLIMPILHANTAISVLLAPTFVRALKNGGTQRLAQRTKMGLGVFLAMSGTYWLILVVFGSRIIDLLYNGQYNDSVNLGILFVMGLIPLTNGFSEIVSGSLRSMGYLNRIFWMHVVSGAVTLTISMGLLWLGGVGGAYVGLFLASLTAATVAYGMNRHGLKHLKPERIEELHSYDSTEAAVEASQRQQLREAAERAARIESQIEAFGTIKSVNLAMVASSSDAGEFETTWQWLMENAKGHNVIAVLRRAHHEVVESRAAQYKDQSIQFVYCDLPAWLNPLEKIMPHLYAVLWQVACLRLIANLQKVQTLDVIHQLSPQAWYIPSLLALLPIPLVWGPVRGVRRVPHTLRTLYPLQSKLKQAGQVLLDHLRTWNPLLRLTVRRAAHIYAGNRQTAKRLETMGAQNVSLLMAGILRLPEKQAASSSHTTAERFRFVTRAKLNRLQNLELVLNAFADVVKAHPDVEYWIFGEGKRAQHYQQVVRNLGIQSKVWFRGSISQQDWQRYLAACGVYIHTDMTGTVDNNLLDAMVAAVPVMSLSHGEVAEQLSSDESLLVTPLHTALQIKSNLRWQMCKCIEEPATTTKWGQLAQERAMQQWLLANHILQAQAVYRNVVEQVYKADQQQMPQLRAVGD